MALGMAWTEESSTRMRRTAPRLLPERPKEKRCPKRRCITPVRKAVDASEKRPWTAWLVMGSPVLRDNPIAIWLSEANPEATAPARVWRKVEGSIFGDSRITKRVCLASVARSGRMRGEESAGEILCIENLPALSQSQGKIRRKLIFNSLRINRLSA